MKTTRHMTRTIRESARVLLRGSAFAVLLAVAGWLATSQDVAPETSSAQLQKTHAETSPRHPDLASTDGHDAEWLLPTAIERPLPAARLNLPRMTGSGDAHRRPTHELAGAPHPLSAWLTGLRFHHERQWHLTGLADRPVIATCPARGPPAAA